MIMKIRIEYNKEAQHLFYLSHLSSWGFPPCVETYKKIWIKETGPLSKKEEEILNNLQEIFKEMDLRGKSINFHITGNKKKGEIWKSLKENVDKNQVREIKDALDAFKERFDLLWDKDKERLKKINTEIKKRARSKNALKSLRALEILFGGKIESFTIHLFAIPEKSGNLAGGADTEHKKIAREIRGTNDAKEALPVALHELSHHLIKNLDLNLKEGERKSLKSLPLSKHLGLEGAWEELILLTLLPHGALSPHKTSRENEKETLEDFISREMREEVKKYLKEEKVLDQEFADEVLRKCEKFAKITL